MTHEPQQRVLVTGGLGQIGRCLYNGLADRYRLVLLDRQDAHAAEFPGAEVVTADLTDFDATCQVMSGVDAVVHLAAHPVEAPFEKIVTDNILTVHTVFEAARRTGVGRVIFASSNHVTGFYRRAETIGPDAPVRPDTFYGASKAHGEAVGRLYADKYGIDVICLRIGSFLDRPTDIRHLSTWLSPRDCQELVSCCLDAPELGYLAVYGASRNTRSWWSDSGWERLGYRPQDDAETFASAVGPEPGVTSEGEAAARQGGWFVELLSSPDS